MYALACAYRRSCVGIRCLCGNVDGTAVSTGCLNNVLNAGLESGIGVAFIRLKSWQLVYATGLL